MDNSLQDLLFQLGIEGQNLIDSYIKTIANRKLTKYKNNIQTGKKEGQSLYTHVLNGIFVFEGCVQF